jgi:hypothetical protein
MHHIMHHITHHHILTTCSLNPAAGSSPGTLRPGSSAGRPGTTAAPPVGLFEEDRAARRNGGSAKAAPGSGAPGLGGLGADDDDDDDEVEVMQEAARPMGRPGGARGRDGQGVLVQDILQAQEDLQVSCLGAALALMQCFTQGRH